MKRSKFSMFYIIWDNIKLAIIAFSRQKISRLMIVAFIIFILALVFAFLAFAPVLSPFVYPLF